MEFDEISINDVCGVKIGNETDFANGTGCTVIVSETGMGAGVAVRGGGPASRETTLLLPSSACEKIHALVLGGGSAYGLDAAGGVMKFLEERNVGYPVGKGVVPLVVQSDIFDLTCGSFDARPDWKSGYNACLNAYDGNYSDGCFGGGTGATVGKMKGMDFCTKTGIGSFALKLGDFRIGAVVVLNALGNVYDESGKCIAGMLNDSKDGFESVEDMMYENHEKVFDNKFTGNTTIGAVIMNASFSKSNLSKIASMAHNGFARAIRPLNTSADGDTVYALCDGSVKADVDMAGTLSAEVMRRAIENAVYGASSGYGIRCARDIFGKA